MQLVGNSPAGSLKTISLFREDSFSTSRRDQSFHDLPDMRLQTRGLADGTLRFEKDDVVNLKVLPVYTTMLINRGRYLAAFNQHERAVALFRQALALDPGLPAAQQGLAESTAKLPGR